LTEKPDGTVFFIKRISENLSFSVKSVSYLLFRSIQPFSFQTASKNPESNSQCAPETKKDGFGEIKSIRRFTKRRLIFYNEITG